MSSGATPAYFATTFSTMSGMAATPPTAKVRPFEDLARTASGAFGSKCAASAMSLRMTMSWPDWSIAVASAMSFWPRALARVIDGPDDIEKSAEPAITAFIAPMPVMCSTSTSSPCFAQRCLSAADVLHQEQDVRAGDRQDRMLLLGLRRQRRREADEQRTQDPAPHVRHPERKARISRRASSGAASAPARANTAPRSRGCCGWP